MRATSTPIRVIATLTATALFAAVGAGAWAVTDDYRTREVLPAESLVAGVDVSGMALADAAARIRSSVAEPLAAPVTVVHEDRTFTLDPADLIHVDVDGMVAEALRPRMERALPLRVFDRATAAPVGAEVPLQLTVDEAALSAWLDGAAAAIDTPSVNATMTGATGALVVTAASPGARVEREASLEALTAALENGTKRVGLAVETLEPAVTADELGPAIIVREGERKLYLYRNGELVKIYGVAVGTRSHPTPKGSFTITLKRYMPTWSNPGSAWAADMPRTIPPGPSNPLGTRALNIDAPGIRIHGTTKDSSIGTAASHGCMRMHRWDIEDLYERVGVGTPVWIVR